MRDEITYPYMLSMAIHLKVAEDDIAFKLAILKKIIAFERLYMLL